MLGALDYETGTLNDAVLKAEEEGFTPIWGAPDKLTLDLDTYESQARFERAYPLLRQLGLNPIGIDRWRSKSKQGMHVVITLEKPLLTETRLALQAMLGSDNIREILALKLAWAGVAEPSVLFKPPLG